MFYCIVHSLLPHGEGEEKKREEEPFSNWQGPWTCSLETAKDCETASHHENPTGCNHLLVPCPHQVLCRISIKIDFKKLKHQKKLLSKIYRKFKLWNHKCGWKKHKKTTQSSSFKGLGRNDFSQSNTGLDHQKTPPKYEIWMSLGSSSTCVYAEAPPKAIRLRLGTVNTTPIPWLYPSFQAVSGQAERTKNTVRCCFYLSLRKKLICSDDSEREDTTPPERSWDSSSTHSACGHWPTAEELRRDCSPAVTTSTGAQQLRPAPSAAPNSERKRTKVSLSEPVTQKVLLSSQLCTEFLTQAFQQFQDNKST